MPLHDLTLAEFDTDTTGLELTARYSSADKGVWTGHVLCEQCGRVLLAAIARFENGGIHRLVRDHEVCVPQPKQTPHRRRPAMADHQDTIAPHDAAETPTVETTLTEAAAVLREARINAVAETAPRLISVADSWIAMAHLIDRRNRDVRE